MEKSQSRQTLSPGVSVYVSDEASSSIGGGWDAILKRLDFAGIGDEFSSGRRSLERRRRALGFNDAWIGFSPLSIANLHANLGKRGLALVNQVEGFENKRYGKK